MTKDELLDVLCDFTRDVVKDLRLPVEMQEDDEEQPAPRPPDVHDSGLPDFAEAEKKAPFIIHQIITSHDVHPEGALFTTSTAVVRSIFGLYHPNSQEGQRALLELLERMRIALLSHVLLPGGQFELDVKAGLDYLIYEKQLPPFYAAEMLTTWKLPPVEREINFI